MTGSTLSDHATSLRALVASMATLGRPRPDHGLFAGASWHGFAETKRRPLQGALTRPRRDPPDVSTIERACAHSLDHSLARRAQTTRLTPVQALRFYGGVLAVGVVLWLILVFAGAAQAPAAGYLSVQRARASALVYERAYWSALEPAAATHVERCTRHSATRVACIEFTSWSTPGSATRVTTRVELTLASGVLRVHPAGYPQVETVETLA